MTFVKITEQASLHDNLEQKSVRELLEEINEEDRKVPEAVGKAIPQIEKLVTAIVERMQKGGRIFYLGAGTSGRARRAGRLGDPADLRDAADAGRRPDRRRRHGVAESGGTRRRRSAAGLARTAGTEYLAARHGDRHRGIGHDPVRDRGAAPRREHGILTACICSNPDSPLAAEADIPIEMIVGPELVTGSSRMKSGTGQKLICNMITTATMIKLGRVKGNRMVNMQLTNDKLVDRGTRMVADELGLGYEQAKRLLLLHGSARKAIDAYRESQS